MKFIGLRLCEHDSNICYSNGKIVKYYKSEREYQIKHHGFQNLSYWKNIINRWSINPNEIDAIGIVIDCFRYPNIKCNEKKIYEIIDIPLFKLMGFNCPIFRIDHHYAHFLSSWTLEEKPTVGFVFDGFGDDWISHSIFRGNEKILECKLNDYPSLGQILGDLGSIIGLSGNILDHAGKLMALKAYGNHIDNNFNIENYNLEDLNRVWNLNNFYGVRNNFQKVCDYLKMCHEITEKIYSEHFLEYTTNDDIISYTGGIAQNTIINSKIKKERNNLLIPPHCNDEGISLGIIEFLRTYYDQEEFSMDGYPYWQDDESPPERPSEKTITKVSEFLSDGKIVGWYQGNGEIGPRALGNRSILMNPSIKYGKDILNHKVKHREFFRPFGASILEEKTSNYFNWDDVSPYMLYVMEILDKESFPSITHYDGTCRIQTVSRKLEDYYSLIEKFESLTGIPMLLNTSLNNGGKPICSTINDALELFSNTEIDILVFGDTVYEK